jgi:hypothetical protein
MFASDTLMFACASQMNLFVGVIYEKYFALKYGGLEELSNEQRDFLSVLEMISAKAFAPEPGQLTLTHDSGCRETCYAIATSSALDNTILGAIILNCLLMASTFYGEPEWYDLDLQSKATAHHPTFNP